MQLYIDSAELSQIKQFSEYSIFQGVTTTPTFFLKNNIHDYAPNIKPIAETINGEVHIEAMGDTADEIIANARKNHLLGENIVSKIPMSFHALKAIKKLKQENIKTNIHLIFSLNQAVMAASAGADYICPLIGRMKDIGINAFGIIRDIVSVFKRYGFESKIMASSIRSPEDVMNSMLQGVDCVTVPPKILELMVTHPLTTLGKNTFKRDIAMSCKVGEIMNSTDKLPTFNQSNSLNKALVEMTKNKIGIGATIDKNNKINGIFTDGDIRRNLRLSNGDTNIKISSFINTNPITVREDLPAIEARKIMEENRISELIVVSEDASPVGYLNLHDIIAKQEVTA